MANGLTISAVNTYMAFGSKNGGNVADLVTDPKVVEAIQDQNVRAAGNIVLPVCSATEARQNWFNSWNHQGETPNYPCN